jgi:hypothetical protein
MRYLLIVLPLLILGSVPASAQSAQPIKTLIDSQRYVFQVQNAQPLRGRLRDLSTNLYTLKVTKDTIVSDLPYFGRAYVAPMDPNQTGLQFTSTTFDYKVTPGKKEGWIVSIKPKGVQDIQELQLNISSAGYASLQVLCSNRDPISFTGTITAR